MLAPGVVLTTLALFGTEVPALALPDWRRSGPREAQLAGAGARTMTLTLTLAAGSALALLTYSAAGPWF